MELWQSLSLFESASMLCGSFILLLGTLLISVYLIAEISSWFVKVTGIWKAVVDFYFHRNEFERWKEYKKDGEK